MTRPHQSPYAGHDDGELAILLEQGCELAFTEIYQRYWKNLHDFAERQLREQWPAKDCVQEVFVALWRNRSERRIACLEGYLLQAVRFQACKAIQSRKSARSFYQYARYTAPASYFKDHVSLKEMQSGFDKVLAGLPEKQRAIFTMHREGQVTYKQIAEKLGIFVKTVEQKMSLSLKSLREYAEATR